MTKTVATIWLVLCPVFTLTINGQQEAETQETQTLEERLLDAAKTGNYELVTKLLGERDFGKVAAISVTVRLAGSAEKLGLEAHALEDFARLRLKNNIRDIPLITPSNGKEIFAGLGSPVSVDWLGLVELAIWTVGEEYPIAIHLRMEAGSIRNPDAYAIAFLGITSPDTILTLVKRHIDSAMEDFAIKFYKARASL